MKGDHRTRRLRILELISTRPMHTQEELVEALAEDGWDVTQSSVSRDIGALRLVKINGAYQRPVAAGESPGDQDEQRIAESVLTVNSAGEAIVVLHTPPGEANRAGIALDRLAWPEVLGTIAGDDTIFIAVTNKRAQSQLLQRLRELVPVLARS